MNTKRYSNSFPFNENPDGLPAVGIFVLTIYSGGFTITIIEMKSFLKEMNHDGK